MSETGHFTHGTGKIDAAVSENGYSAHGKRREAGLVSERGCSTHGKGRAAVLRNIGCESLAFYRKYSLCDPGDTNVNTAHERIISAIEAKDPDLAEKEMREHLKSIVLFAQA